MIQLYSEREIRLSNLMKFSAQKYFPLSSLLMCGIAVLWILTGCSPAMPAPSAPAQETETRITPVPTPAQEEPAIPTQAVVPPEESSPLPEIVEDRTVEMEWPETLRLGDSDVIRLAIVPTVNGYVVEAEFPEHLTQQRVVYFERPPGYDLYAAAALEGIAFEIAPTGEQVRQLRPGETSSWYWSLAANDAGRHRLALTLTLRWVDSASGAMVRETQIFSRAMNVQVTSFFGMPFQRAQQIGMGLLGFVTFVIGWGFMRRKRQAGHATRTVQPAQKVVVESLPGLDLSNEHARLLKALFAPYARLLVNREFLSGYSGARTFLIQPIRPDDRSDAYTIAKIGPVHIIEREYSNYENFVKDTLPPVTARIQHAPVTLKGTSLAAIRYTFLGEAGQVPSSLRQILLADPDGAYLRQLYDTFGPTWWRQNRPYAFRIAQAYDHLLPAHLILKPVVQKGIRWRISDYLDERMRPDEIPVLQAGAKIPLRKFTLADLRSDGKSISLRGQIQPGHPPLRITWLSREKPAVGTLAEVVADRWAVLEEVTRGFDRCGLPDPLAFLPQALQTQVNGTQSIIHGDLNLENILVGPGGMLWLIDFASTQEGHTLADFAHLGAELIAHVLIRQVEDPQEFLRRLAEHQFPLLNSLDKIAAECMFNPAYTKEFQLALYMSCIGGLKYINLDASAKQLLYLTAAYLSQQIQSDS
jgi:hypothetical protein